MMNLVKDSIGKAESLGKEVRTEDWTWQQQHAIRDAQQLKKYFPDLPDEVTERINKSKERFKFQLTPYYSELIKRDPLLNMPEAGDPLWKQVFPEAEDAEPGAFDYNGENENWENEEEMVTPICQHKYDNRVIIRLSNNCLAYCQFCYEALRTLKKDTSKSNFKSNHWQQTVAYIRNTPTVEEVILSGGEPLMLGDDQLEEIFKDLRSVDRNLLIRVHTRALTYNPYRLTPALLAIFKKYHVNSIGIHVAHPNELSAVFEEKTKELAGAVNILFANIPLLKGINDDALVMKEMWMKLYRIGIVPHYLYHFMPFSPGSNVFRTDVFKGVEIIYSLKRKMSNIAVPEYVLPHFAGKFSIPILEDISHYPKRVVTESGQQVLEFTNWKGQVVNYPI